MLELEPREDSDSDTPALRDFLLVSDIEGPLPHDLPLPRPQPLASSPQLKTPEQGMKEMAKFCP
jgi:hypothetical protein